MSSFKKLDIPQSIMELPVVKQGTGYNKCGHLVNVESVKMKDIVAGEAIHFDLLMIDGQIRPPKISQFSVADLNVRLRKNTTTMTWNYNDAVKYQKKVAVKYALTAASGALALSSAVVAVSQSNVLDKMAFCAQGMPVTAATRQICSTLDTAQPAADVKQDVIVGGVCAVVLGVAAIAFFKSSRLPAINAKMHYIKAALLQGNAICCDRELTKQAALLSQDPV